MYKYVLLFSFLSTGVLMGQEWTMTTPLPQEAPARHHPVNFTLNGYGYLGTGGSAEDEFLDDFWRFDPINETWEELAPFPGGGRSFSYGVSYENKAYVGFGRNENGPLNDLWEYDPETNTWTELDTCLCVGRTHPALVAANGHIYVGLGGGGGNKKDWWAYNIESGEWEQRAEFPSFQRHHPFYFEIDDYAYVGMGHGDNGIYNDLYRYDHLTDSWETLASLPGEGRVAGTQFSLNGKGYVLSGDGQDHDHMEAGEFWEYDPVLNEWTALAPHLGNGSRWAPGNFIIDNTIYFMAGLEAGLLKKDMMRYTFDTSTSLANNEPNASIRTYPNPVSDVLYLEGVNITGQLQINALDGKVINRYQVTDAGIDLSGLEPGMYFISLKQGEKTIRRSFVKI